MAREAVELRASAAIADVSLVDGRVPNRVMLLPIGPLDAVDGRKWRIDDRAHADSVVAATRQRLGRRDFMFDYDHQSHRAPAVAGRAMAAGWAKADGLHVEDDGIYAEVEWTAQARSELRDRQYRYISPEFGHTKDGRITRLFTAALTNTPALEMAAVASAEHQITQEDVMLKDLALKLGLAEDADETAIASAIDTLQSGASLVAIATALKLKDDASAEDIATAAAEAAARPAETVDLAPIAAALGAGTDATVEQLATAAALARAGTFDATKFVPIETHQLMIGKVAKSDEERATASVDAAIEAGKIAPANRDWALGYFKQDEAGFTTLVSKSPVILEAGEGDAEKRAAAAALAAAGELTDEERAVCATLGITEETYLSTKKELA